MKKIVIWTMLAFFAFGVRAQETVSEEDRKKKKEINEIKKSEESMYADVVVWIGDNGDGASLAEQQSVDMLRANIIEGLARKTKLSKEAVKDLWDTIDDKIQNIELKTGDMIRVFSYIGKDAACLGRRKPDRELWKSIFGYYPEEDPSEEPEPEADPEPEPEADPEPVKEEGPVIAVQLAEDETAVAENTATEVIEETPVVAEQPATQTIPALCQTMLEKENLPNLLDYLRGEVSNNKVIYGNSLVMQYPEKCYIVIVEKKTKKIATVLGIGEDERMNWVTGQMESFSNYRGGLYQAVFVQEL